jgi:bifunctional non-homologous end joining protein LigD
VPARPAFVKPQFPSVASRPPHGTKWCHERKLDGYRVQVLKDGDRVRIYSRNGIEITERLPGMVQAFDELPATSATLDGELCSLAPDGRPNFRALHAQMRTRRPDETSLMFFCFDILFQDGVDLTPLPLSERKKDLRRSCSKARVRYLKWVECFPDGGVLLRHCEQMELEGVVSKRLDRPYVSGQSQSWQKTKCAAWRRENQFCHKLFEGHKKPPALTEREKTLQRRKVELARIQEGLAEPALRAGMKAALKAQERALLQEIAELEK